MRRATPPANEALSPSNYASLGEPAHAAQPLAPKASSKPWKFTLAGKLTSSFAALAVIFAASVSIIAYARLAVTFENEMKRRAELSVMGLAELALRHGDRGGELQLRHAVEDYAADLSIAYIYVEDPQGRIIAHMPRDLPAFLLRDFPRTAERAITGVEVLYRDLPVYEIAARIGKDQFGYVHLGMWRHAAQAETRHVVTSIVVSILLLLCAIVALFAWAVCYLTLPLSKLVLYAHRVSRGDLDVDIEMKESEAIKQNNEVGSLARSFARMRSSLHAILTRLEGAQQKNPFNEFR
jgi:HAMP domain-containing protein